MPRWAVAVSGHELGTEKFVADRQQLLPDQLDERHRPAHEGLQVRRDILEVLIESGPTPRSRGGPLNTPPTDVTHNRAGVSAPSASNPARHSTLCRSHSAAVSEVGAVEREMVTTTNLIFMGTQRVHTSLASGRSGPTLTVTRRPVNSGLPLIANADQRPLMRPPEAGAQVRILSGAPSRGHPAAERHGRNELVGPVETFPLLDPSHWRCARPSNGLSGMTATEDLSNRIV